MKLCESKKKRKKRDKTDASENVFLCGHPRISNMPSLDPASHNWKGKWIGMSIKVILSKPSTCRLSSYIRRNRFPRFLICSRMFGSSLVLLRLFWAPSLNFKPWEFLMSSCEWLVTLCEVLPHAWLIWDYMVSYLRSERTLQWGAWPLPYFIQQMGCITWVSRFPCENG